jgi:hypothetical protein
MDARTRVRAEPERATRVEHGVSWELCARWRARSAGQRVRRRRARRGWWAAVAVDPGQVLLGSLREVIGVAQAVLEVGDGLAVVAQ